MLLIYLALGALTGTISGMLGLGGGIIVVPALSIIFLHISTIPPSSVMHMAIGTSLAIMVLTSLSGMYVYHKSAAVRWDIMKTIFVSLLLGTLIGSWIADSLSSTYLRIFFGIFLLILGFHLFIVKPTHENEKSFSKKTMMSIVGIIGLLSSILGIGGGTLFVPFFLHCRTTLREAMGTSLTCGMMIGIIASVSFMLHGFHEVNKTAWSTGYIYWPALIGVSITSMLFTPLGHFIAHKLPTALLKKIFVLLLWTIAIKMLWF